MTTILRLWNARSVWLALLVCGTVPLPVQIASAQAGASWRKEAREYGWQLDYQAARQTARDRRLPLMVVLRCVP